MQSASYELQIKTYSYVFRCWHITLLGYESALTLCMLDNPFHAFDAVCWCVFFKINFFKYIFQEHYHLFDTNDLDPDQDRRSVGAKLGPECLQRL